MTEDTSQVPTRKIIREVDVVAFVAAETPVWGRKFGVRNLAVKKLQPAGRGSDEIESEIREGGHRVAKALETVTVRDDAESNEPSHDGLTDLARGFAARVCDTHELDSFVEIVREKSLAPPPDVRHALQNCEFLEHWYMLSAMMHTWASSASASLLRV